MKHIIVLLGVFALMVSCRPVVANKGELPQTISQESLYNGMEIKIPEGEKFVQYLYTDKCDDRIVTYDNIKHIYKVYRISYYLNCDNIKMNLLFTIK